MDDVTQRDLDEAIQLRQSLEHTGMYGPIECVDPHDGSVQMKIDGMLARALASAREEGRTQLMEECKAGLRHAREKLGYDSALPPKGHVLTDDGTVRKVCGKFVLTADGAIACEEGDCWAVVRSSEDDPWEVRACRRSGNPEDYGCWWNIDDWSDFGGCEIASVWSTPSAAESARPTP